MAQTYDFLRHDYTTEETERYLFTIIKDEYSSVYASQIITALKFAQEVYGLAREYTSVPYILHAMRVSLMLIAYDRNITSKVFTAALLHDIIMSKGLSYQQIELQFGAYVAKIVASVARYHVYTIQGLYNEQHEIALNWQKVFSESHEVRAIITFEVLDNIICWKAIPEESRARKITHWLDEAYTMFLPLAHATNMQAYIQMQQEYIYYVG